MDHILIWCILLMAGLFLLIKAADFFNRAAENIGLSLGLSPFIIGVVLVGIGTSLPELISSCIAVVKGFSEIVPGNVLGSNIANIFLIIGIISALTPTSIVLTEKSIIVDLQFLIGSALFTAVTIYDGIFNVYEGLLCICMFIGYIFYQLTDSNSATVADEKRPKATPKDYLTFMVSSAVIYLSADLTIEAVIRISDYLQIGKEIIAASMIAVGTSLPELVVSISATKQGNADVAIGNIVGSCIFNVLWVMGFSSLFGTIVIPASVLSITLPFMLIATFLFFVMTRNRSFSRYTGILFLLFFVLFMAKLFSAF
ncbi:calcium/sodium antiporter [Rhodocytophaga aerolata]|uniref:Calcium/sodium antiporter n=1 Tax=Rhodocytophaga aerolata TaxID=455078 RepID=A0ABT8R3D7_9BACT|nr:calcium/sodium antiporter [Rhodocytophaga aerolata]MDO1446616.1 calcium/sodium antiporter [Rhodocytophaga aerolata]